MPRAAWALAPAAADDHRECIPVGAFDVRRWDWTPRCSVMRAELGERQRSVTLALFCVRYVCVYHARGPVSSCHTSLSLVSAVTRGVWVVSQARREKGREKRERRPTPLSRHATRCVQRRWRRSVDPARQTRAGQHQCALETIRRTKTVPKRAHARSTIRAWRTAPPRRAGGRAAACG